MSLYKVFWRGMQVLRWHLALRWWTAFNYLFLRLHPSVKLAEVPTISGHVEWLIDPRGSVEIGRGVRIHSSRRASPIAQAHSCIYVGAGAKLRLADSCGVSGVTIVCTDEIEIGPQAMLGGGCTIFDSDFHSPKLEERLMDRDPGIVHKPVRICAGAFVGANSMIMKGVTIGERAVIASGSVVFFNVPPDSVFGGNPARRISMGSPDRAAHPGPVAQGPVST
jgi:acetyltransferase-like isoleucine patch superfamily enzyme